MKDPSGTKQELIKEISELKQIIQELEQSVSDRKRAEQEMAAIAEIGRIISSTMNIDEVYARFAETVRKIIPFDRIVVNIINIEMKTVTNVYMAGHGIADRKVGVRYPLKGSGNFEMVRTKSSLLIQTEDFDEYKDRFPMLLSTFQAGFRSIMNIPLFSKGEIVGGVLLRSFKPYAYTDHDVRLAERVGNQIAGAIVNAQLFTDLKKTEKSLRESESRFRGLVEQAAVGVAEIAMETGKFITVNRRLCEMVGRTKEEMLSTTFESITHPEDLHLHEEKTRMLLAGEICHYSLEKRYLRKDGGICWVNITVSPLWKPGEAPGRNIVVVEDITERKRMEEDLLRAHKLESLGVLAGGIAHDFNNLMAIVQGYVDLALMDLPPDHVSRQRLLAAMKSVEQTMDLTSRLITFSRGRGTHREILDVAEIIRDAVQRTVKGTAVRVRFDFMENLWPAEVDELQIKHCFYNLTTNAVEAMPGGGTLSVQVERAEIAAGEVLDLKEGSYLKATFTDEGIGIPKEHLLKIFDPYFTTKMMGAQKGLGLGLSICYSVLMNHGGQIMVKSQPGEGTSFALYLPARTDLAKEKTIKKTSSSGTFRALIMDDEPQIREIERAFLEQMGYEVTDVKDGQEVIDTYTKAFDSDKPFDLVMLDLTVHKGMGGRLAMEQLLKFDPSVRAIIASGYVDDPVIENYASYGFRGVLKKPFKREELKNLMANIFHA